MQQMKISTTIVQYISKWRNGHAEHLACVAKPEILTLNRGSLTTPGEYLYYFTRHFLQK